MRPSESLFWLPTGWLRPNFVAVRLDETENRTQQPGYPGDVGRKNAWARRVMGGDSILTIGRLCMANLLVMVVAAGGIHSSWAEQPVAGIAVEAAPSAAPAIDAHQPSALAEKPTPPEQRKTKVPILVYHHIRLTADGSRGLRRMTVTAEVLDQQMKFLQDRGYHVITFSDLADYFEQGRELPTLPVIITFDDGWVTQYENALPLLAKYHFPATFFVVTDDIGHRGFVSWPQLQTLLTGGMKIGSHSRSHPRLTKIADPALLWDQIYNSKVMLESQLEVPVAEFAYPYGSYNTAAVEMVKAAGYRVGRGCCTGVAHTSTDVLALRAIMAPNDLTKFQKYLEAR
jgi:peptidoglycan/xylan/chitin deacetylase (PgdA/CDA1 family)